MSQEQVNSVCVRCRCKTKLAAALARCRVKLSLQSVSCILSDPVRTKQQRTKLLPLYAWVNALQTRYNTDSSICEHDPYTVLHFLH